MAPEPIRNAPLTRPAAFKINRWYRAASILLGLAGLGSGGAAVFITHLEAGPVALLVVGLILLLIGMGGRMPSRIKIGENEAAWEAVQDFVERVTEVTPSEARPELVEALADLAKEVPQVASAGMRGLAYENLVVGMINEVLLRMPSDPASTIMFQPSTMDLGYDARLISPDREVAVVVKHHARPLTADSIRDQLDFLADEPGRTQKKIALLLISRTPMANDALRILNATGNIYAVVIEGLQDREKLAMAIYNALGLQQTGRYFT